MIKIESSPLNFFLDKIHSDQSLLLSDMGSIYLASLLTRMTISETLYSQNSKGELIDQPYAIQFLQAQSEPSGNLRALTFQRLGDCILFYSGFFREKISRDGLSLDYYFSLGEQSYQHAVVSSQLKQEQALLDLGRSFSRASDLIHSIKS